MSQANPSSPLENESIGKLLFRYSLPAIAAMLIMSLYNIVDSIFIGHGVNALGLAGLAVAFPLMNLTMAVCFLVVAGGSSMCSIEMGRKNLDNARRYLGHVVVLGIGMGILAAVGLFCFLEPVLVLFGASEQTLPYAYDFMRVVLLASPITFVMLGLNHMARASGYPTKSLLASVISVLVNIVLAPLFIFGFEWGMRGAAFATVSAQVVALIWLLLHFMNKQNAVCFTRGIFSLSWKIARPMLGIGMSSFLMNLCACLIIIVINLSLFSHGGDMAIGAYGISNRLLMAFAMIIVGLTNGMQPIIGYNFGAQKPGRVLQTLKYAVIAASVVTSLGFLISELLPTPMVRMFTDDPELIDLAVTGLRISAGTFFLIGAQIVIAAYFQFIGKASVAIFLSLIRQMLLLLPTLLILPRILGLNGVWGSIPLADFLAFIVTLLFFRWSLSKKLVDKGSPS